MYLIFQQSDFDNIISRILQELTDANILLGFCGMWLLFHALN